MKAFECFLINDSPAIWGKPDLLNKECYGLQPGTQVTKIGRPGKFGNETSDNKTASFAPPITYRGLIHANTIKPDMYDPNQLYAAFEVPSQVLPKRLFAPLGHLYMLFLVMEHGYLWQKQIKLLNVAPYQAIFETVK